MTKKKLSPLFLTRVPVTLVAFAHQRTHHLHRLPLPCPEERRAACGEHSFPKDNLRRRRLGDLTVGGAPRFCPVCVARIPNAEITDAPEHERPKRKRPPRSRRVDGLNPSDVDTRCES
jgi:hypothetical protein